MKTVKCFCGDCVWCTRDEFEPQFLINYKCYDDENEAWEAAKKAGLVNDDKICIPNGSIIISCPEHPMDEYDILLPNNDVFTCAFDYNYLRTYIIDKKIYGTDDCDFLLTAKYDDSWFIAKANLISIEIRDDGVVYHFMDKTGKAFSVNIKKYNDVAKKKMLEELHKEVFKHGKVFLVDTKKYDNIPKEKLLEELHKEVFKYVKLNADILQNITEYVIRKIV